MKELFGFFIVLIVLYVVFSKEKTIKSSGRIIKKEIIEDEFEDITKFILYINIKNETEEIIFSIPEKDYSYYNINEDIKINYSISKWNSKPEINAIYKL